LTVMTKPHSRANLSQVAGWDHLFSSKGDRIFGSNHDFDKKAVVTEIMKQG
jgi:hypothetical protein